MSEEDYQGRGKQWVVKSNDYIEAKFTNYKPTLAQNRVVLWLASKVHSQKDEEFETIHCSGQTLRNVMRVGYSNKRLVEELTELRSATAVMKRGSRWSIFGIIDIADFDEETDEVILKLGERMKPFLLRIGEGQEGFTSIELEKVQSMRSVHSQRIYELLIQFKNLGRGDTRLIKLQTLKEHLGLYEEKKGKVIEKFKRWLNFEERVLKQAEKDLCEAGLLMCYEPIKKGRGGKVVEIKFRFSMHKDKMGETLPEWARLALVAIDEVQRIMIGNTRSLLEIEQAIASQKDVDDLEPILALLPKNRTEYHELMKQKFKAMYEEEAKAEPKKEEDNWWEAGL